MNGVAKENVPAGFALLSSASVNSLDALSSPLQTGSRLRLIGAPVSPSDALLGRILCLCGMPPFVPVLHLPPPSELGASRENGPAAAHTDRVGVAIACP